MLNDLTVKQAISLCVCIRDKLELDFDLPLEERWKEKDALATLINYAETKLLEG